MKVTIKSILGLSRKEAVYSASLRVRWSALKDGERSTNIAQLLHLGQLSSFSFESLTVPDPPQVVHDGFGILENRSN